MSTNRTFNQKPDKAFKKEEYASLSKDELISEIEHLKKNTEEFFNASNENNLELKRSNEELDDFTYVVSHDLKEPLRGIRSNIIFLIDDYKGKVLDEDAEKRLNRMSALTDRMNKLIGALTDYSKIGKTELRKTETDLNKVLSEVIENLSVRISENSAQVKVDPELPAIKCDAVRVSEIFTNLISNGIKYNDEQNKLIEIGIYLDEEGATSSPTVFYVKDNGISIPTEHRENVFKIFKRLHGKDEYGGGSGAGLTIVKKLVEQHRGKIWVESEEGQGSIFYFTLEADNAVDREVAA